VEDTADVTGDQDSTARNGQPLISPRIQATASDNGQRAEFSGGQPREKSYPPDILGSDYRERIYDYLMDHHQNFSINDSGKVLRPDGTIIHNSNLSSIINHFLTREKNLSAPAGYNQLSILFINDPHLQEIYNDYKTRGSGAKSMSPGGYREFKPSKGSTPFRPSRWEGRS
jgi:hypothetical protein